MRPRTDPALDVECSTCQAGVGNRCRTRLGRINGRSHVARKRQRAKSPRFKPVDLNDELFTLVLARNEAQAQQWMEESGRRVRNTRYVSTRHVAEGTRPQVLVYLPGWFDHPDADRISDVLQRGVAHLRQPPFIVHVYESGT